MNFFCQLSANGASDVLEQVKKLTRHDRYLALPGYKTMSSHFRNEFVVKTIMANKPLPDTPNFVRVFKATGVDMVHLAEFHYTAHPQGPDDLRLLELKYLFDMCRKYSDNSFLLLAKIDNHQYTDSDKVAPGQLLAQSLETLEEHFIQKGLILKKNSFEEITLNGNAILTEIMINNMLLNAIRHTPVAGEQKLDETLLFKRFSRLASDNSGTGPGLAIINEICKFHHWTIGYRYHNGFHHFIVAF
ncbi:MAG: hypothetical protein QM664_09135 [Flavihumibacter sp.]